MRLRRRTNKLVHGLNLRQEKFVELYARDLRGKKAAVEAGYSEKTAAGKAYNLLGKPEVQKAVVAVIEKDLNEVKLDRIQVLKELMRVAFFNIADLFDGEGYLKPFNEVQAEHLRSISALEIEETLTGGKIRRIKVVDKLRALELLCRHLNLLGGVKEIIDSKSLTQTIEVSKVTKLTREEILGLVSCIEKMG